jgi:phage tail sheath protein FI
VANATLIDVFRNNDETLWKSLQRKVQALLTPIWRAGGLRGASEEEAFSIKLDAETNPQESIDRGEVNGKIGLATQKPGLFFYFNFYRKVQ